METFYEDPSMFFENYEDFVDSSQKNNILEIIGDVESQKKTTMLKTQGILPNPNTKMAFSKVQGIWSIPIPKTTFIKNLEI